MRKPRDSILPNPKSLAILLTHIPKRPHPTPTLPYVNLSVIRKSRADGRIPPMRPCYIAEWISHCPDAIRKITEPLKVRGISDALDYERKNVIT